MAKDAESHSADDKNEKDRIEARNRADSTVYQVEKMLKDHRDKVSEADAKAVEEALDNTKKKIAEGSIEDMNKAVDALTAASHKLAEAMYKASSSAPQGNAPPQQPPQGEAKKEDDVVDAEFVDVDDKGKK
jgi:molecular chaperone DnaK